MVTRLEEMENWLIGKEPPRWQLILRDTVYGIDYDAKVDIDALLAVAEAAAEVFGHKDWELFRDHILVGDDDDWYAPVLDKINALDTLITPLFEEVTE